MPCIIIHVPTTIMHIDIKKQFHKLLEKNEVVIERIHHLSDELNLTYNEIKEKLVHYVEGKKVKLEKPIHELIEEIHKIRKQQFIICISLCTF